VSSDWRIANDVLVQRTHWDVLVDCSEGGVEVGDVDAKAKKLLIPVDGSVSSGFDQF
jgi:succinyl-CoA synthetase beta subunit